MVPNLDFAHIPVTPSGGSRPCELRGGGGGGLDLLALSAIFPSVISSFFTKNKGGGAWAPGPLP